ncbi:hypothetical protein [Streptomyces sp. NPDC101178]|uniref:hypothetical protein n=1 Tax=Streptomyces sp. NPDC101178 TaxID=3366124 RepID=UPI0037FEF1C7
MLQCTAVTDVPYYEALLALTTMKGGPARPSEVLDEDEFLLCELGEHDESAEHAAYLWAADTVEDQDLWLLWTGSGAHRVYRFEVRPVCPARLRHLATGKVETCAYFDHHPGPHSFFVTDPLGEIVANREERRRGGGRDVGGDVDGDADGDVDEP